MNPTTTLTSLPAGPLDDLRRRTTGPVLVAGDAGYDEATAAWNLACRHHPLVVVEAADVNDVAAAVRFAADQDLGVGVQATGHGMTLPADGGVLVSTRRLHDVVVNPETRTAWVGGGCQWGPVLEQAQRHGLAPLLGSAPHVGAVGYVLGGGFGWLTRRYGSGADSVRAFEVVSADGRLVRASADEHPELFRALRGGGGGSLGIVTGMEVQLYPVTTVYGGDLFYPPHMAEQVITRWAEWVADAPDELTSEVVCMNYPPIPEIPEPIRGQSFVIMRGCWAGALDEGHALLDAWKAELPPLVDMWRDMPFSDVAAISNDPVHPVPAVSTGGWLTGVDAEVAATLAARTFPSDGPPVLMFSEIRHVGGGALARGDRASTTLGHRDMAFVFHSLGVPMGELDPAALTAYHEATTAALGSRFSAKAYLNFIDGEERRRRTAAALSDGDREALAALKGTVDPDDVFRFGVDHRG
jgi:hypothetical protein